jgi:hypothetical protein
MIVSSLVRAAAVIQAIYLHILFCFLPSHVAVATQTPQPRAQLQSAATIRQEIRGQATPATSVTMLPFTVPTPIIMNQPATIGVLWTADPSVNMVVLCQTNATEVSLMASNNTWVVLPVDYPGECTLETPIEHVAIEL